MGKVEKTCTGAFSMIYYNLIRTDYLIVPIREKCFEHPRIKSEFERKEVFPMTIKKVTKKMAVTCKCKSSC